MLVMGRKQKEGRDRGKIEERKGLKEGRKGRREKRKDEIKDYTHFITTPTNYLGLSV